MRLNYSNHFEGSVVRELLFRQRVWPRQVFFYFFFIEKLFKSGLEKWQACYGIMINKSKRQLAVERDSHVNML